jgi:hypothetical protein
MYCKKRQEQIKSSVGPYIHQTSAGLFTVRSPFIKRETVGGTCRNLLDQFTNQDLNHYKKYDLMATAP